jgi:ParB-like chromosome segregation protein Spo0J
MKLLYTSISHDGYTQPVVTVYDEKKDKYVIVDGFHRYFTSKRYKDISERNHNRLPVVVIDKDINDRMASTIRHNRARGKHSVSGMSNIVFEMLDNGWEDVDILKELGMEAEELIRLKHITGFSKLFEDTEYKQSWELKKQLQIKKKYKDENPKEKII